MKVIKKNWKGNENVMFALQIFGCIGREEKLWIFLRKRSMIIIKWFFWRFWVMFDWIIFMIILCFILIVLIFCGLRELDVMFLGNMNMIM